MTMKDVFMAQIEARAEQIRAAIVEDALQDISSRKTLDITPTEAKELADKHVKAYLAQELYLSLSKTIAQ